MIVLGIETSCDETAAAVVDDGRRVRADVVQSQLEQHRPYGGVVPEIAARSHLDHLDALIAEAMRRANLGYADLDGIAATGGPGLIGGGGGGGAPAQAPPAGGGGGVFSAPPLVGAAARGGRAPPDAPSLFFLFAFPAPPAA